MCRASGFGWSWGTVEYVAYCLGGLEAERFVTRRPIWYLAQRVARDDCANATEAVEAVVRARVDEEDFDAAVEAALEAGRRVARDIVRRHWDAITKLADYLFVHGRVWGTDVVRIACEADLALAEIMREEDELTERLYRAMCL